MMSRQMGMRLASLESTEKTKRIKLTENCWGSLKRTLKRCETGSKISFSAKAYVPPTEFRERELKQSSQKKIFIEIEKCHNLPSLYFHRQVCPFVLIKWNEKSIGWTPVLKKTSDPIWYDECFEFPAENGEGNLTLEVWDLGKNDALTLVGYSKIPSSSLSDKLESFHPILSSPYVGTLERVKELLLRNFMLIDSKRNIKSTKRLYNFTTEFKVTSPDPFRRSDDFLDKRMEQARQKSIMDSTSMKAMCLVLSYLFLGVIGFSFSFESWSIKDSLYFSVVTFTTVGKHL